MPKKEAEKPVPATIITLTLPRQESVPRSGTLLVQRGELAHVRQFTYTSLSDFPAIIKEAVVALADIEANPPKEVAQTGSSGKVGPKADVTAKDDEPVVEVPLKKGRIAVKVSHLKIAGGEADEAAYRQGVVIAGRLMDGKLWDGKSPIRITDVDGVQQKLKHLTDAELGLFELTDFVQVGEAIAAQAVDAQDTATVVEIPATNEPTASENELQQPLLI